ncbi:WG repeat-containing protein [Flavobacterium aquiphilum]|uniref:WG repeat-containing protein n=1 Tax=Flavobacterium aquiphilum TaxID=3003261 RepID=UPI00247FE6A3|nr:WG repeat-containing protein [Flavobacterium aquiphilum]
MKSFFTLTIFLLNFLFAHSQVPTQSIKGDPDSFYLTVEGSNLDDKNPNPSIFVENKKYGIKQNSTVIVKPVYDYIDFSEEDFKVKTNNKFGIINKKGETVLETKYDSIGNATQSYIVKLNNKYGTVTDKGIPLLPVKYSKILYSNNISKTALIRDENKELKLVLDNVVSNYSFDNILIYKNSAIISKNSKKGLIAEGKLILEPIYDNISRDGKVLTDKDYIKKTLDKNKYFIDNTQQNIFITQLGQKQGLIENGVRIYADEMDKINNDYLRGIIIVEKDKKQGAYLPHTKQKIDMDYSSINCDGTRFIELKKNNLSGMVDYKLNQILPSEYDDIQVMGMESAFKIIKNKKQGWASAKGEILIPTMYDDIDDFNMFLSDGESFKGLFKVKNNDLTGVIDQSNKIILPLNFEFIFERNAFICGKTMDGKFGLYKKDGSVILKPEYKFIFESENGSSKLLFALKESSYSIINKEGKTIYDNSIKKYGYILNEYNLVCPFFDTENSFLLLQDTKNKYGVYDEVNQKQCLPQIYNSIKQKLPVEKNTYFVVSKNNKFGIVDDKNTTIVPFLYDDLSFDLANPYTGKEIILPAKKNGKWGLISLKNKTLVDFGYQHIAKIDDQRNIFKAKIKNKYKIINGNGKALCADSFDDVANFEGNETLTFDKNTMKVINDKGAYTGVKKEMTIHDGYKTFDELKFALIEALENPKDDKLMTFCTKIAPSKHILYYLTTNVFDKKSLKYTPTQDLIAKQYFKKLSEFKLDRWNDGRFYNKGSLKSVNDYTYIDDNGIVTNSRTNDHAYGDTRLMEKIIRNAVKVNGFWISSYFMHRNFEISDY